MSVEAFATLVHEVHEQLDRAPVRGSLYEAIVAEVRVARFVAEHAENLDEVRNGVNRSYLELALRNVLGRPELAGAHDAARRALQVVVSREDERKIQLPMMPARFDVDLALVHVRDAVELLKDPTRVSPPHVTALDEVLAKLEGVVSILERVHAEHAA